MINERTGPGPECWAVVNGCVLPSAFPVILVSAQDPQPR